MEGEEKRYYGALIVFMPYYSKYEAVSPQTLLNSSKISGGFLYISSENEASPEKFRIKTNKAIPKGLKEGADSIDIIIDLLDDKGVMCKRGFVTNNKNFLNVLSQFIDSHIT